MAGKVKTDKKVVNKGLTQKRAFFNYIQWDTKDTTIDRLSDDYFVETIKEYLDRAEKEKFYPATQFLLLYGGWDKREFYKFLKTSREINSPASIWYDKLKMVQQNYVIQNLVTSPNINGLIYIAKNVLKLDNCDEEEQVLLTHSVSILDSKITLLKHDIDLFFKLAGKETIDETKNFIHLEGGRAGGKSEQVARYILYKILSRVEKNGNLLCGREIQKSIKTSVKPMLERVIKLYELEEYFDITNDEIRCKVNQCKIIFLGLKEACSDNSDTLKSTDNLFCVWVEEAQSISEMSLDKLIPTAMRVDNFQIIFTYNRHRQNTVIYDYFFNSLSKSVYSDKLQHININYYDNKFNSPELIAIADAEKQVNLANWKYIWNGEPQTDYEGGLWAYEDIKDLNINITYDKLNYIKRIVATDPATTSKDISNEYGITVLGLTEEGYIHLIDDVSGHYKAFEYAKKIVEVYNRYDCECVVYEENQGGEHIANTILNASNEIRLIPVRAKQSKYLRALPIANMCNQGKIMFIKSFPVLENQMLLMTTQGYKGESGASPDRLDSFVWGCHYLAGLDSLGSVDVYFKRNWFKSIKKYDTVNTIIFYYTKADKTVMIKFDYFYERRSTNYLPRFNILEIKTYDTNDAINQDDLVSVKSIMTNAEYIYSSNEFGNRKVTLIETSNLSLAELVAKTIMYVQEGVVFIKDDNLLIDTIIKNICMYNPDIKENIILESLLEVLYNEFN